MNRGFNSMPAEYRFMNFQLKKVGPRPAKRRTCVMFWPQRRVHSNREMHCLHSSRRFTLPKQRELSASVSDAVLKSKRHVM